MLAAPLPPPTEPPGPAPGLPDKTHDGRRHGRISFRRWQINATEPTLIPTFLQSFNLITKTSNKITMREQYIFIFTYGVKCLRDKTSSSLCLQISVFLQANISFQRSRAVEIMFFFTIIYLVPPFVSCHCSVFPFPNALVAQRCSGSVVPLTPQKPAGR